MSLGQTLRNARLQKGLKISDVAEHTNMLIQIVENLENEDFSRIAAPLYGRSFVKLYAELLELDPKPLVAEFMHLYSGARAPTLAPHAQPVAESKVANAATPAPVAAPPPAPPTPRKLPPAGTTPERPITRAVPPMEEETEPLNALSDSLPGAPESIPAVEEEAPEIVPPAEPDLFTPPAPVQRKSYADSTWQADDAPEGSFLGIRKPESPLPKLALVDKLTPLKDKLTPLKDILREQKRTIFVAGAGLALLMVMIFSISQIFKLASPSTSSNNGEEQQVAPPPPIYVD